MNNDKLKFVVDSHSFDGSCVTTMSDGIHGDYHHETLEELRDREKNPYLTAVSGNTVRKMIRIHLQSLCAPFSEITEERYFDYMDVLPPIRHTRNFFFLEEPYHADIYRFCFRAGGRYFTGLRSVTTPRKELERQMDNHYRNITFKGDILKEKPMVISDHARHASIIIVPYLFLDINGEKKFIYNLMRGTDESSGRDVRLETSKILQSLRRHHFLYFSGYEENDDMDKFLGEVMKKKHTLLANGNFLQYPVNRESVSFTGTVRETGEPFFFRIYDRELFLHLLYVLRGIKSKYSINSLVYWVTYVHNVVYSFYRSMIYCYINSTQRCAGSIVIDIIPTNGADKRKFFPFAPYFPVTNVIKRYFYPYFPAIIGIKGYSFPYFPYLSGIMKIKTALYSLFSRLDWHKTVVFPCLGEIYEGIRSLSWEIPVT